MVLVGTSGAYLGFALFNPEMSVQFKLSSLYWKSKLRNIWEQ